MRTAWDAIIINSVVLFPKPAPAVERDISLVEMNAVTIGSGSEGFTGKQVFVQFDTVEGCITQKKIRQDLWMFIEETAERWNEEF